MTPATPTENQTKAKTYLALGDSYTIGERVAESERWPVQLAVTMVTSGISVENPKIIARTGWRTDELIEAIAQDDDLAESYDLVSLLIGVNNQYQGQTVETFLPEFEELVQTSIRLAGNNPKNVMVLSIPDYGKTPFAAEKEEEIEKAINQYNKASRRICRKYKVKYIDITDISRRAKINPLLVADDKLHPSGKMYEEWMKVVAPFAIKRMKK